LANSTGNTATIENNYNTFQVVPSTSTLVASYNATTSNQTTDSTLQTTYGVSISPNQPAGTYTGAVKYTMNYTEYIPPEYMQDFTLEKCMVNVGTNGNPADVGDEITVIDIRDGNDYTVRYINGACWMTQNLRITGTVASTDSNFDRVSSFNISEYDLTNGAKCSGSNAMSTSFGGYTNACAHNSNNTTQGVWYNFVAASAGQITGRSNTDNATQDICPSGWHLPTGPSTIINTDLNKLVDNTASGWQITTGLSVFGAVAGGFYDDGMTNENGIIYGPDYGFYWSATSRNSNSRYDLQYYASNGNFTNNNTWNYRYLGYFVRCVKSE
ncbi:hypothetical protein IJG04_01580, partial [Candidatus Saccharibacteria bacterium]|nr:hypothetical protein [Candidatus Saccharibacteria bacterium]